MAKPSYQYHRSYNSAHQRTHSAMNSEAIFEFDEPDLWSNNNSNHHHQTESPPEFKKSVKRSSGNKGNRVSIKQRSFQIEIESDSVRGAAAAAASLPVNIPDWSRILRKDDDRRREKEDYDANVADDDDEDASGSMIPPHEFLARQFARTRIASFSVHEGIGRTLKGRDLRRIRDVILKKTGFED